MLCKILGCGILYFPCGRWDPSPDQGSHSHPLHCKQTLQPLTTREGPPLYFQEMWEVPVPVFSLLLHLVKIWLLSSSFPRETVPDLTPIVAVTSWYICMPRLPHVGVYRCTVSMLITLDPFLPLFKILTLWLFLHLSLLSYYSRLLLSLCFLTENFCQRSDSNDSSVGHPVELNTAQRGFLLQLANPPIALRFWKIYPPLCTTITTFSSTQAISFSPVRELLMT